MPKNTPQTDETDIDEAALTLPANIAPQSADEINAQFNKRVITRNLPEARVAKSEVELVGSQSKTKTIRKDF